MSWPARLKQAGLRSQFVDVTDVMPTILEAAGVPAPDSLAGVAQKPFDGVSFAYSFTQPKAPSRHRTQYFEVFGNAAIYHDGWLLAEAVKVDPRFDAAMADPDYLKAITTNPALESLFLNVGGTGLSLTLKKR